MVLRILNNVTITTNSAFTSYMGISNNWIMSSTDDNRTFISGNSISGAMWWTWYIQFSSGS
jgi:hypothetical protein